MNSSRPVLLLAAIGCAALGVTALSCAPGEVRSGASDGAVVAAHGPSSDALAQLVAHVHEVRPESARDRRRVASEFRRIVELADDDGALRMTSLRERDYAAMGVMDRVALSTGWIEMAGAVRVIVRAADEAASSAALDGDESGAARYRDAVARFGRANAEDDVPTFWQQLGLSALRLASGR